MPKTRRSPTWRANWRFSAKNKGIGNSPYLAHFNFGNFNLILIFKMNATKFVFSGLVMAFGFFAGCADKTAAPATNGEIGLGDAPASKPKPGDALIAGQWCYDYEDETLHLTAVMEYDGAAKVVGNLYGDIHDKAEGYFTSYTTSFDGTKDGNVLKVKSKTEIEGDVQEEAAEWTWDGKTLDNGRQTLKQVDCEPAPDGE